jgi:hypothetical protein
MREKISNDNCDLHVAVPKKILPRCTKFIHNILNLYIFLTWYCGMLINVGAMINPPTCGSCGAKISMWSSKKKSMKNYYAGNEKCVLPFRFLVPSQDVIFLSVFFTGFPY